MAAEYPARTRPDRSRPRAPSDRTRASSGRSLLDVPLHDLDVLLHVPHPRDLLRTTDGFPGHLCVAHGPDEHDVAVGIDLDRDAPSVGGALAQEPAAAELLLDLGPDPRRVALDDRRGAHVRDLDAAPHRLDARHVAHEPDGLVVQRHVSQHARQNDLAARSGLERDAPAIGRAHTQESPVPKLLLGLSLIRAICGAASAAVTRGTAVAGSAGRAVESCAPSAFVAPRSATGG